MYLKRENDQIGDLTEGNLGRIISSQTTRAYRTVVVHRIRIAGTAVRFCLGPKKSPPEGGDFLFGQNRTEGGRGRELSPVVEVLKPHGFKSERSERVRFS